MCCYNLLVNLHIELGAGGDVDNYLDRGFCTTTLGSVNYIDLVVEKRSV